MIVRRVSLTLLFFFNDTATTEIYTLSLHDALPISSIAHEIRNRVGAMSHGGQLVAESPRLAEEDRRLTQIIRANADRVSGIIDNVQRLSRRERARLERLSLSAWTEEFHAEFCETMQWPRARLTVGGADSAGQGRVGPHPLRPIPLKPWGQAPLHRRGSPDRESNRLNSRHPLISHA